MAPAPAPNPVTEPFPISRIAGRYLLFDVHVIAHCRRAHNICGVLIGTIPNLSQQNVFLGVPLELMPEEARVLVEKGAAYLVDDTEVHRKAFGEMNRQERLKYLEDMDRKGEEVAREQLAKAENRKDKALKEKGLRRDVLDKRRRASVAESPATTETVQPDKSSSSVEGFDLGSIMKGSSFSQPCTEVEQPKGEHLATLFDSSPPSAPPSTATSDHKRVPVQRHYVTPTASPISLPTQGSSLPLPTVPNSYPLFRYLHSRGYFHMPGLRFGCHYNVYPGDPLRYHSHFAATGMGWDQEFDLLDVVGGGRLGTGTKKAYMIGGEALGASGHTNGFISDKGVEHKELVRAFSVEWAAL
ncbi:tRNA-splicing endonuclease subunit [Neocucurbitaria cava]|uniref:tRNA-splicing endonuclease subunit Sen34 n=1 Tax=Neocucurbitaria cava TaxID=798079 RepID=A0A9W9CKB9_9PLEO|nr:tRNA-splicing endonuclease subunit [Neocucurbitaria cava]